MPHRPPLGGVVNTNNFQRMKCPKDCNGNGKCLSMRQLGLLALDSDSVPSPVTYGSIAGNPLTWDADAVFGCYCDWMVRQVLIERIST